MPSIRVAGASKDLRLLFEAGTLTGFTDGQLLERFTNHGNDTGELAFAALLDRHGPMVLGVCEGVLHDSCDAEDAFQATFLVLARKAGRLWVRDTIGPWLFNVAYRIAIRARSDRARRWRHERASASLAITTVAAAEPDDVGPILHEEIRRLPETFRTPIVLCHLQGLTHDQAAQRLGWPVGTVRSRLSRGRDRLRGRLDERGVAFTIAPMVPAAIRPSLAVATARAASQIMSGMAVTGMGQAVYCMTREALKTMMLKSLFKGAATILAIALMATGVGAVGHQFTGSGKESPPSSPKNNPPEDTRPAAPPKSKAEMISEGFLKVGSNLFNAKDAAGLAATYTEDGEILLVGKRDGQITEEVKRGRTDIEQFYRDSFKDKGGLRSENTAEVARLIAPDVLVVQGRFRADAGEDEWPFVQMRRKIGDRWLLSKLWLFLSPGRDGGN